MRLTCARMRRTALVLLLLGALLAAGCGSSKSSSSSSSSGSTARDTELGYFPAATPIVMLFSTETNGAAYRSAGDFIARFPLAKLLLAGAESSLARVGVNYTQDVKPILGNAVALGSPAGGIFSSKRFMVVFVANDAGKLDALMHKPPAPRSIGSYDGAKLYQSGQYTVATAGATAILASSETDVKEALARHQNGQGIHAADFSRALTGLPQPALLQIYGDLTGVLSRPSLAKARRVPWVAALRSYGATLNLSGSGMTMNYRIDTTGSPLTGSQLPLPTGSSAPSASGPDPIEFAIRDVAHAVAFGAAAVRAASPRNWASAVRKAARNGINLQRDLLAQLTGNGEVDYGPAGTLIRSDIRDPAVLAGTLAKARGITPIGGGLYTYKQAGRRSTHIGIVAGRFVAGTAPVTQLRAFASRPTSQITGVSGPVAFRASIAQLVGLMQATQHSSSPISGAALQLLGSFGALTGWAANDRSSLTGAITLPLK